MIKNQWASALSFIFLLLQTVLLKNTLLNKDCLITQNSSVILCWIFLWPWGICMCLCCMYALQSYVFVLVCVPGYRLEGHIRYSGLSLSALCPWDSLSMNLELGWSSVAPKLQRAFCVYLTQCRYYMHMQLYLVFYMCTGFILRFPCLYSKCSYPGSHLSSHLFC